jgi:cytochrome c553
VLDNCARCHGHDGAGRGTGAFPRIGGQHRDYLEASLKSYAEGRRASGIMQTAAAALDESELAALAEHYAAAAPPESPGARGVVSPVAALSEEPRREPDDSAQALRREGERIAREGLPAQGVPACVHCHGPDPVVDNPGFPRLAGQHEDYLLVQLALWSADKRGGSPYARLMTVVARGLEPEQQRALAAWYASLTPRVAAAHRRGATSSAGQPRAELQH